MLLTPDPPLHQRQKGGVDGVGLFELVSVLTQEHVTRFDELGQDESEDFSEVETGDHLFEGLLARLVGRLVDDDVELSSGCEVFHTISLGVLVG